MRDKEIKDEILEQDVDVEQYQEIELTEAQIKSLLQEDRMESVPLDPFYLDPELYDEKKYEKGIENASEIAGFISSLSTQGVPPMVALDFLMNIEILKNNLEIAKIQKEMNIEMSKNNTINMNKGML